MEISRQIKYEDSKSFKKIFDELYPDMLRLAIFYVSDAAAAEDITQETFAKLWEKRKDLGEIENLKGYLQYSIKNRSLNYIEHLQVIDKYQKDYLKQATEEENPEEFIQDINKLLDKLPEKRKTVLELSIVEAMTYQQIADRLDISVNTVKDHIKKAYAFLRKEISLDVPEYILYLAFKNMTGSTNS